MLDTSVCPSRSARYPSPPIQCCKLYQQAPLPFDFWLGLASEYPRLIRGRESMRETWGGAGSPSGWLHPLTHGHGSCQVANHTGSGVYTSPRPFKHRGGQVAVTYCTGFCGFPTSCPHLCK